MINFPYPKSKTDCLLNELGYDLFEEYFLAVENAKLSRSHFILDVGTGSGRMVAALLTAGHMVISGDRDPLVARNAHENFAGVSSGLASFTTFDAHHLGFPDSLFEAVISADALHDIADPFAALSEMARVCGRFGKLVVLDFHEEGIEIVGNAYRASHGEEHGGRVIPPDEMELLLGSLFEKVERYSLPLNTVWTASGKREPPNQHIPSHERCFVCGHRNPQGLNVRFHRTGDDTVSGDLTIGSDYGGYPGIAQGGVTAAVLDSAMANCLYLCRGIKGVTAKLEVRYMDVLELNVPARVEAGISGSKICMYEVGSRIVQSETERVKAKGAFFPCNR